MHLKIAKNISIGKLIVISLSTVLFFSIASVIVANVAISNIDTSQSNLTRSSIPALIFVNQLSTTSFNLIQSASLMKSAESINELDTKRDNSTALNNKLKYQLDGLKNYNFPNNFISEIENILHDLEENVYKYHEILSIKINTVNNYNKANRILIDSTEALSDLASIMKVEANTLVHNKYDSIHPKLNKQNYKNLEKFVQEILFEKEKSLEIVNRINEIQNTLQILNKANTNESILFAEQEFDHAVRIITRAIVNYTNKRFRNEFSSKILLLIKHGQDNPDIFSHRKKLVELQKRLNLIDNRNIELTNILNSSVAALSNEVKNKTDHSAQYLKNMINYGKAMIYTVTIMATLVGIILMLVAVRRVTNPLYKLLKATKEIGKGNLDYQINIDTNDEIGELAKSFNLMAINLKDSNDQIQYLAYHDTLTGLPNRRLFNNYLKTALVEAERNSENLAVMFLDLDNFKRINDSLGHDIGDELLKIVASRISKSIRKTDTAIRERAEKNNSIVARIGGDEFILLFSHLHDSFQPSTIANRLLKKLSETYEINGESIRTHASIGIAVYPDDSNDADELVKYADIAMYEAKENGKGIYQYYSNSMNTAIFRILTLENKLHKAVNENQLELYYQPILNSTNHEIVGAEALIRWNDPELGVVSPDAFIPLAEESGSIIQIGEWVIKEACKQIHYWNNNFNTDLSISVNVSSIQFSKQNLREVISNQLRHYKINPNSLHIEITESILMSSSNKITDKLKDLKSLGIKISLDDFGTGYSSLSYLQKFPIDVLKIDRQFTSEISKTNKFPPLVSAIISMAHGLNLKVVAEGVENEFQMTQLMKLSCDQLQGYFFSRPVAADEMTELIRKSSLKIA